MCTVAAVVATGTAADVCTVVVAAGTPTGTAAVVAMAGAAVVVTIGISIR